MRPTLERALDAGTERLVAWSSRRLEEADRAWLEALRAELGEIGSAWQRLAWAAGGLQIVWGRNRTMRWLRSAGGLGGWRTYPWGVALGIVLLVRASADWHTREGSVTLRFGEQVVVTLPALVQVMIVATFLLAGAAAYLAVRRSGILLHGTLVGGLTGALGVTLAIIGRVAEGLLGQVSAYDVAWDVIVAIPFGVGATTVGLVTGGLFSALATPGSVVRAFQAARAPQ